MPEYYTKDDTSGEYVAVEPSAAFQGLLPEDVRSNEALAGIQDAGTLAQQYLELRDKVPSLPESPDGYEFDALPEGVSEEEVKAFLPKAHELGLTAAQVKGLLQREADVEQKIVGYRDTTLRERMGKDADGNAVEGFDPGQVVQAAEAAMKKIAGEELTSTLKRAGYLMDPAICELFHKLGQMTSESPIFDGKPNASDNTSIETGMPMLSFPNTPGMQ